MNQRAYICYGNKVNAKIVLFGLILFVVLVLLVFIVNFYPAIAGNFVLPSGKGVSLRVGAVLPLTGNASGVGESLRQGLEWKVDELRSQRYPIELIVEDSQSDSKQAVSAFNSLVDLKGVNIVFTISSSSGMSLKPLAEQRKVLLWADITHPEFTNGTRFALRHSNIVDYDAKVMARAVVSDSNIKKVVVFSQQDDFGKSFGSKLADIFGSIGITAIILPIDSKSADFRAEITKAAALNPDAFIFIAVGSSAGYLIKQSKELGYAGKLFSSVGFVLTSDAQKVAGDSALGTYYQTYEINDLFEKDYMQKFGSKPSIVGYIGYTDIELLVSAVNAVQSNSPEKIVDYIKGLQKFYGKYESLEISPNGDIVIPTIIKEWNG